MLYWCCVVVVGGGGFGGGDGVVGVVVGGVVVGFGVVACVVIGVALLTPSPMFAVGCPLFGSECLLCLCVPLVCRVRLSCWLVC